MSYVSHLYILCIFCKSSVVQLGGGQEVNLDDDVPPPQPQSKLEFRTPDEEFSKPSMVPASPPAELKPSEPPKPQARTSKSAEKTAEEVSNLFSYLFCVALNITQGSV